MGRGIKGKHMTKDQEIKTLREAVDRLGQDGYCGLWLQDQIPAIDRDMRSDLAPMLSYREVRNHMDALLDDARREAMGILSDAKVRADEMVKRARKEVDDANGMAVQNLKQALRHLGGTF